MNLLHEMLETSASAFPEARALTYRAVTLSYSELASAIERAAGGLVDLGLNRGERVAVWMPKRMEKVVALYATLRAGGIAVPINALLRAPQVGHILRDSGASVLVTTSARLADLLRELPDLAALRTVVTVDGTPAAVPDSCAARDWTALREAPPQPPADLSDGDVAALFYTSGSTGRPKGVVVSHRNLVTGARSVSGYLRNTREDRLLAVLSLGFDYGFSQLTTAFAVGASVVLPDLLLPRAILRTLERERITGLAAVPPLWIQLADLPWPAAVMQTLRYITNSGGTMPQATLRKLRSALPRTRVFLMYGLTEAFRSTYLPPEELDRRPDSIGKAIPGAEVLVVRPDGTPCAADEPGELVHRGALVARGYWNDPELTAQRFRPMSPQADEGPMPDLAVWSGDVVRRDADGFLYFVGRRDEMIKTSGLRVSPTEIEEEAYATGLVGDAVAVGVPHPRLGQAIMLVASPCATMAPDSDTLLTALRRRLPRYMVPLAVDWRDALPRNANGKFDRARLRRELLVSCVEPPPEGTHGGPGEGENCEPRRPTTTWDAGN